MWTELLFGGAGFGLGVLVSRGVSHFQSLAQRFGVKGYFPDVGWQPYNLRFVSSCTLKDGSIVDVYGFYSPFLENDLEVLLVIARNVSEQRFTVQFSRVGTLAMQIFLDNALEIEWEGIPTEDKASGIGYYLRIFPIS